MENIINVENDDTVTLYELKEKLERAYLLRKDFFAKKSIIFKKTAESFNEKYKKKGIGKILTEAPFLVNLLVFRNDNNKTDVVSFSFTDKSLNLEVVCYHENNTYEIKGNVDKTVLDSSIDDIRILFSMMNRYYDEIFIFTGVDNLSQTFMCDDAKATFSTDTYGTLISLTSMCSTPNEYIQEHKDEILKNMRVQRTRLNNKYRKLFKENN